MRPFRIAVACLLLLVVPRAFPARAAEDRWYQATSPHFLLFTDTSEAKASRLLTDLESRVSELGAVFGPVPERQLKIEIVLFGNIQDFKEVVDERQPEEASRQPRQGPTLGTQTAPTVPDYSAYLYKGPDRIFIAAVDASPNTIAKDIGHALGHVFLERMVLWRPFWLSEGIAEYFKKIGASPDTKAVTERDRFPVEDLLKIVQSGAYKDSDSSSIFRVQAYRLLRVLADREPRELRAYVKALGTEGGKEAQLAISPESFDAPVQAYRETQLTAGARPVVIAREVAPEEVEVHRGDLILAAGHPADARRWYNGNSNDASAARAILARFTSKESEALAVLGQAATRLPDAGLLQFHFGSIEVERPSAAQVQALERAVRLLPKWGRAHGELGRVYVQTGSADKALAALIRAIELEPESADKLYLWKAEALLALKRPDEASAAGRLAVTLPHSSQESTEVVAMKQAALIRRAEQIRDEAEMAHVDSQRREVAQKAAVLDPPRRPQPRPEPRVGSVDYAIEVAVETAIVEKEYPVFPDALVEKGTAGTITLSVNVGEDGKVTGATVQSSDVPELNNSAISAAKRWRFQPARKNGRPLAFTAKLTFTYRTR